MIIINNYHYMIEMDGSRNPIVLPHCLLPRYLYKFHLRHKASIHRCDVEQAFAAMFNC